MNLARSPAMPSFVARQQAIRGFFSKRLSGKARVPEQHAPWTRTPRSFRDLVPDPGSCPSGFLGFSYFAKDDGGIRLSVLFQNGPPMCKPLNQDVELRYV